MYMQFAPVVLKDSANTDQTFSPRDIVQGVATYVKSTGVPIADKRITVTQTRTPQGRVKVNVKFTLPVVQDVVVSGVNRPTLVRAAYADLTFAFDSTSSFAERNDLRFMIGSFMDNDVTDKIVAGLETLY